MIRKAIILIAFLAGSYTVSAQTKYFEEPEYEKMVRAFQEKEYHLLEDLLLEDIKSEKPNAFTYYIAQLYSKDIDENFSSKLNEKQQKILAFCSEIAAHEDAERYLKIYTAYKDFEYKDELPVTAYYNIMSATSKISYDESIQIFKTWLSSHGVQYRALWMLDYVFDYGQRYEWWKSILKDNFYDDFPELRAYAEFNLNNIPELNLKNWSTVQNLENVNRYLKANPNDPEALRRKAILLENLKRKKEALLNYEKAYAVNPFYFEGFSGINAIALQYDISGDFDEKAVSTFVTHHYPNASGKDILNYWKAKTYHEAGDKTKASSILRSQIENTPSPKTLFLLAQIEASDDRFTEVYRLLRQIPSSERRRNLEYHELWLEALKETEAVDEMLENYRNLTSDLELHNQATLYEIFDFFENSGQYELAEEVQLIKESKFPNSNWTLDNLGYVLLKNEKFPEAEKVLLRSFELNPVDSYTLARYKEALKGINKDVEAALQSLAKQFPGSYLLKQEILNSGDTQKNWNNFIASLEEDTSLLNARLADMKLSKNSNRRDFLLNFHEKQLSAASSRLDSIFFLDLLNWEYRSYVQKYTVAPERMEKMLELNKHYETLSGNLFEILKTRAYLYRAAKETELSQNAIQQAIEADPTSANIDNAIVNFHAPGAFKEYRKVLEKNLNNYENLKYYTWANVLYGGSNINAIWAYNKCKSLYPNQDCQSANYYMALKNFGNPLPNMNDYKNSYSLGTASRYIGWYNQTRKDVFDNLYSTFQYDEDENTIKVYFKNGEEYIQKDDPLLGRPVLKQKGKIWIKYGYTENGKINRIETSANEKMKLQYNEKDQIITYDLQLGKLKRNYKLGYNEAEKMNEIILNNQDTLRVFYDEQNEVDSTYTGGMGNPSELQYNLVTDINMLSTYTSTDKLENIHLEDPEHQELASQYEVAYNETPYEQFGVKQAEVMLQYLRYLKDNLNQDSGYATEILNKADDIFYDLSFTEYPLAVKEKFIEVFDIYYDVLKTIRKRGVALDYWQQWIEIREYLETEKDAQKSLNSYRKSIEALQKKINDDPIVLLESAKWLAKSDLNLDAFWHNTSLDEIEEDLKAGNIHSVLKRANGDMLLSAQDRLMIKEKGYWKVLKYDPLKSKLTNDPESIKMQSKLQFKDMVEVNNAVVFNTNTGTFVLDNNYEAVNEIITDSLNYIGDNVAGISASGSLLFLYSNKDINVLDLENHEKPVYLNTLETNEEILKLIPLSKTQSSQFAFKDYGSEVSNYADYFFVQTSSKIELFKIDHLGKVVDNQNLYSGTAIQDFLISSEMDLYVLDNQELFSKSLFLDFASSEPISELNLDATSEIVDDIQVNKEIIGLFEIPTGENENSVAVITDNLINVYKDSHFELLDIKGRSDLEDVMPVYYSDKNGFGILSDQNLYEYTKGNYVYYESSPEKIQKLAHYDLTLTLNEGSLDFSDYSGYAEGTITTDGWGTSISDFQDQGDGSILIADYMSVYESLYDPELGDFHTKLLFEINPIQTGDWITQDNQRIKSIHKAEDGTIWLHTAVSVFRYNPDATPILKEFSFVKNPDEFPVKTLNIFNLIETYDGKVWVINDEEPWNNYKGMNLDGGLMVYNKKEDKFELFDAEDATPDYMPWFVTSYTPLNDYSAIVGTTSGFAMHGPGGLRLISGISDSYRDILDSHRNLFLGTKGIEFGDILLFGTGEGVIGYKDEEWFYPDRLNQILPQFQEFGRYGGTKVKTLAVDHLNRLQISTDLGLVIIDSDNLDPNDLLMMDYGSEQYLEYYNKKKLKNDREVVLNSLTAGNETKKVIEEADEINKEIDKLESLKKSFDKDLKVTSSSYRTVNIDSVNSEIKRMSDKHSRLLLTLKEKNPVIYQALKVPPLEIAGIRKKLNEDECVVQYIPLQNKLLIQLISKDQLILKEIDVAKEYLFNLALYTSDLLSNKNRIRGAVGKSMVEETGENNEEELSNTLTQLYNYLLEPIENELKPFRSNIQIMAEGVLNYIPFEALKNGGEQDFYALNDYNFTYLSSLYMYQLFDGFRQSGESEILLVGDPDSSLPHAREEVENISSIYQGKYDLLIGSKAKLDKFRKSTSKKGILHLATHGFVDENTIKDSWLLFNDNKLSLSQIYEMNLEETNLVVLSACETGIGKEGLETTSLAQAFANAGVKYLIASLWKVNDESTKILMEKFYTELNDGKEYMDALHEAKQYLIGYDNGKFSHPKYWSPFIIIGKS